MIMIEKNRNRKRVPRLAVRPAQETGGGIIDHWRVTVCHQGRGRRKKHTRKARVRNGEWGIMGTEQQQQP